MPTARSATGCTAASPAWTRETEERRTGTSASRRCSGGSELSDAAATLESPYGTIHSGWRRMDGEIALDVTLPAGTSATVRLPAPDVDRVLVDGKPAAASEDAAVLHAGEGFVELRIGSGRYVLTCPA
ncbi:alpha-L-rhamnosidase C-terminal domain-containing protein [Cohnella ginsengisoli]|uniref:alpha-L-rhamnosidase C-terminal domain-containing protein n=1 Tax=Cohnella ginsengisoli TaxID=425004 RepID=UPI003B8A79FB